MPSCVVKNCKNYYGKAKKEDGITYHRFPKSSCIKEKWIKAVRAMGRGENWFPVKQAVICSSHFCKDDFTETKNKRTVLKKDAHPIFKMYQRLKENGIQVAADVKESSRPSSSRVHYVSEESGTDDQSDDGGGGPSSCAACEGRAARRLRRRVCGSQAEGIKATAMAPQEVTEDMKRHRKNAKRKDQSPLRDALAIALQKIILPNYKRAPNSSIRCLFPNCRGKNLHSIPQFMKLCFLRDYNLYAPKHCRICEQHLSSNDWAALSSQTTRSDFTAHQIEDVISILKSNDSTVNFENIEDIHPNLLHYFTGVNHRQFQEILDRLPSLKSRIDTPVLALAVCLTKLRTKNGFDRLTTLFQDTPISLAKLTKIAKDCMLQELVPYNLMVIPSEQTRNTSEVDEADDRIIAFLEKHFYKDTVTATEACGGMRFRLEALAAAKQSGCGKRTSDSEDNISVCEFKAKKVRNGNDSEIMYQLYAKKSTELESNSRFSSSEVEVEFENTVECKVEVKEEPMEQEEGENIVDLRKNWDTAGSADERTKEDTVGSSDEREAENTTVSTYDREAEDTVYLTKERESEDTALSWDDREAEDTVGFTVKKEVEEVMGSADESDSEGPTNEGEATDVKDQELVYAPPPTDDPLVDPLHAVPVKQEEATVKLELDQAEQTKVDMSYATVYYTKGTSNFKSNEKIERNNCS